MTFIGIQTHTQNLARRIVTDDFIHVRRALRAAKTVEDVKQMAPRLLEELEAYLGEDISITPGSRAAAAAKPAAAKPAAAKRQMAPPSAIADPPAIGRTERQATWGKLVRFEFAFSEDKTEDADLRIQLLEVYDKKYTSSLEFRTLFDILLQAMDPSTTPLAVPLARRMADRCLGV